MIVIFSLTPGFSKGTAMRKPGVNKELQVQIAVFHTVVPLANGLQLRSLIVVLA